MEHLILQKYEELPREMQIQVLDYIDFLLFKYQTNKSKKTKEQTSNFGSAKGLISINDDFFDAPLDDFKEYM